MSRRGVQSTLTKMRSLGKVAWISLVAALLSGCPAHIPPIPNDTLGRTESNRGDIAYVPTSGKYRPDDLDLRPRNPIFGKGGGIYTDTLDVLSSVYFEFDQASIDPSEREKLNQAADRFLDIPSGRILVEGHCDWRGTAEYNIGLGDRRANSVKEYLVSLGVPTERIETNSRGDLDSTPEGSEDEMSHDRRADLIDVP